MLSIRERVSGTEHPAPLVTKGNLAYWYGQSDNVTAARDIFADLLEICERIFGDAKYEPFVRENLAEWTSRSGDAAGARARYTELLPIQRRVLGADHPSTLKTRELLPSWTDAAASGQDAVATGSDKEE